MIIIGRTIQVVIRTQVIDPFFFMNKNLKEDAPKTLLTQIFDINEPTVIYIPVNKEDTDTPRTQVSAVKDLIEAS